MHVKQRRKFGSRIHFLSKHSSFSPACNFSPLILHKVNCVVSRLAAVIPISAKPHTISDLEIGPLFVSNTRCVSRARQRTPALRVTALPPLSPLPSFSHTPRSPIRIVCLAPSLINMDTFSLLHQGSRGTHFLGQGSSGTPFLGWTPGFPWPAGAPAGPAAKVAAPQPRAGPSWRRRRPGEASGSGTPRDPAEPRPGGGGSGRPRCPGAPPLAPGGPLPFAPPHRSLSWSSVPGSGCTTK